jgi:hypothetical protein
MNELKEFDLVSRSVHKPVQVEWITAPLAPGCTDTIHRTISSASVVISASWPTEKISADIAYWHECSSRDIDALKIVVNFQRKYINYQALYNAFLLGTLSEDEFDKEADGYIAEERAIAPEVLAPIIERLHRLLDFTLSDREIAEYLEVDRNSMSQAFSLIHRGSKERIGDLPRTLAFLDTYPKTIPQG